MIPGIGRAPPARLQARAAAVLPHGGRISTGNARSGWLAGGTRTHRLKSVAKIGGVRNGMCAVLDGVAEGGCRATVKAERDAAKSFLKGNAEFGRDFCENGGLANCLLNCN